MNGIKIIFLFFLLWFVTVSHAQTLHHQVYHLLKKHESLQINTIFQDRYRLMWFGTSRGLFRFDGKNYQHYTQADSLPDNNVTAIAQDTSGRIWLGHYNGNVCFLENGKFRLFEPPEGLPVEAVSDLLFDDTGRLWLGTFNDGLYYYTGNRLYRLDEQEGLPDLYIYDILQDTSGNIWAGTDGGMVRCSLRNGDINIRVWNNNDGLPDNIVKKLALAEDGTLWLGTEDAGLFNYNPAIDQFKALTEKWSLGSIKNFAIRGEQLWISTSQGGLLVYDKAGKKIERYSFDAVHPQPVFSALFTDREGNVWAGSKTSLIRTPGDHLAFIESFAPYKDKNVFAVEADRQGNLWYATKEGLFKRSMVAGNIVVSPVLAGSPFNEYRIISLYADEEGFMWAGLYGQGVLRIDPLTGRITHLNKELRNGNVLNITGHGKTIWLATLGGGERINMTGDQFQIKNYSRKNGLSSDFIYQVFVDSRGQVWFATDGKGVDMLNEKGIHHYEAGLPSKVVYGLAEDHNHQIWVNIQGNGIYKLDSNKFEKTAISSGFRDNNVNVLSTDANGNIVVMHDLGIDVYDVGRNTIRYFDEQSGLRRRQAILNAVAHDSAGNLFIGTDSGIIRYAARRAPGAAVVPHVTIESFKVFDQHIERSEPLLSHSENNITLSFLGLWYQNPDALRFQYKLDNFDDAWIATGNRFVTYSKLPPGNYTFRVKVSDNPDFNYAHESTARFTIEPPFWNTLPFYIFSIAFVVAGGYGFMKYREKKLKFAKLLLQRKVEERTREIQQQTEEIQAQNEEILAQAEEIKGINENLEMLVNQRTAELEKKNKALEEYAFINAHKLRSPVASILGLINLISKTNLDDEAQEINRHLKLRADELDDVVRSITQAIERGDQ